MQQTTGSFPRWIPAAVAACLMALGAGRAAADDGLLAHWQLDAGAGFLAADSSGNGNDGDAWGPTWVSGVFGTALHFAGGDGHVAVPEVAGLDGSDQLTVEAWVQWESVGQYPNIITGGRWSPGGFLLFVNNSSCTFRMGRPGHAAAAPGSGWQEVSAPLLDKIEPGRWYHLAATFQRPQITTYVNGVQVGSAHWDYPVGYAGDIIIGKWAGKRPCHHGLIDEVKIYNQALSAADVQASFAAEAPRRTAEGAESYMTIPDADQNRPTVVDLENDFMRLAIDDHARCTALIDRRTGRNYIAQPLPLISARIGGKTIRQATSSFAAGKLRIELGDSQAQVVLGLKRADQYLLFEVLAAEGEDIEELTFVTLSLPAASHVSPMSGLVADDEFGVCLRAVNLQTQATVGGQPPVLRATAYDEYGLVGAQAGLVAAPTQQLRPALQQLVGAEVASQSDLGGPWAIDAQANRGSYLFAAVSEDNVDRWIDLAQRGGFTIIHFIGWEQTLGHYEPRPDLFPNGIEGLKATVRKIHDAGLKAGMHTLTGCIATRDSWVTPVPDKRLAADASYTLAADMSQDSDAILTVEMPGEHDTIWSYAGRGNVIRIDEELIHYAEISTEPPYGFLACTRGAFGTRPGNHAQGAVADHLRQVYLAFYPDETTTLVGEVADAIARVYNECEMDQIYMDGAEGMGSWHAVATMRDAIFRRLQRPATVEASSWGHWSWYYHSRVGAWDHPKWGLKQFTDMHCEQIPLYRQGSLLQGQMGWWVILGPSDYNRSEMPDEMEYFSCKTLAHDVPMSIQGIGAATRPANARMEEYLTTAGQYERLRLANYFSEAVRGRLREPGKDFHLQQGGDGAWEFVPTDYIEQKVTSLRNGTNRWVVDNQYETQPLRLRLEALDAAHPYDSDGSLVLADFGDLDAFSDRTSAPGVTQVFASPRDEVKAGGSSDRASVRFSATNSNDTRRGAWTKVGTGFLPHFDMEEGNAIGLWVHGDGKGEILNVQLSNPREYSHAYAEHYVTIDFTGWRYFELLLRERDSARYRDYGWPYYSQHGIYRTFLTRDHVSELNLYLNNLPPDDTATVYLSPIKTVRTADIELRNPRIEVNGKAFTLPVRLPSGSYLELESSTDCRVYDARCELLERIRLPDDLPSLRSGENQVTFTCPEPEGFEARASVTITARGPAFRGSPAADEIDWALLRQEYELPRLVTALDGDQNRWDVACRPSAESPQLHFELTVEQTGARGEAYDDPAARTIESFEDLGVYADSPDNEFAKYVYDGEHANISTKPGVTQSLDPSSEIVKVGTSSARYSATSTRSDNSGWSARGRRFPELLDLSASAGIGLWLHGDDKGEVFKLQLRDDTGAWHDMTARVDFSGWRRIEFDLGGANLDLARIEYLLFFYNAIPAGQTVTCHVDDIRVLPRTSAISHPTLAVSGQAVTFPVQLFAGDRLAFDGMDDCRIYRTAAGQPERVRPTGTTPALKPGRNPVTLTLGPGSADEFRLLASLVKVYP